jgi:hypothetical protein
VSDHDRQRHTARDALRCARLLPGYRIKILDGNHLPHSERRLGVLRSLNVAPLPGHTLVVLDPAWMLAIDAFPCEDAQPQERGQLPQVLETVKPRDLWIADRAFVPPIPSGSRMRVRTKPSYGIPETRWMIAPSRT